MQLSSEAMAVLCPTSEGAGSSRGTPQASPGRNHLELSGEAKPPDAPPPAPRRRRDKQAVVDRAIGLPERGTRPESSMCVLCPQQASGTVGVDEGARQGGEGEQGAPGVPEPPARKAVRAVSAEPAADSGRRAGGRPRYCRGKSAWQPKQCLATERQVRRRYFPAQRGRVVRSFSVSPCWSQPRWLRVPGSLAPLSPCVALPPPPASPPWGS